MSLVIEGWTPVVNPSCEWSLAINRISSPSIRWDGDDVIALFQLWQVLSVGPLERLRNGDDRVWTIPSSLSPLDLVGGLSIRGLL